MPIIYLEEVESCNGWLILRRTGAQARRERLPTYIISTPDTGRHLEEFRALRTAQQWCKRNNDYVSLSHGSYVEGE